MARNHLNIVIGYLFNDEQRHWEEETGLTYPEQYDRNAKRYHVFHALVALKHSKLLVTTYYVHDDALTDNYVIGCGDTKAEAVRSVSADIGHKCSSINAQTLSKWAGIED